MQQPPAEVEAPEVAAYPIAGPDRERQPALGVIAKRTYIATEDGTCVLASQQTPIHFSPIDDPEDEELILADTEFWLDKPLTDVVIRGHAWNHPGTPSWLAQIRVGREPAKQVLACGDRRCLVSATGRLVLSEPERCDRVELSYRNAYGGRDVRAEQTIGYDAQLLAANLPANIRELAVAAASPFLYPRNPGGRGYLVDDHPEAIEALRLPLLEDPRDRLTAERVHVRDPWHWPLQPLPCSLDWLPPGAFPRIGWFGHTPDWDPDDIGEQLPAFPELRFGYAEPAVFERDRPLLEAFDRRALNGASLGLRYPLLRGDETLVLDNLHPRLPRWTIRLPGDRPRLAVDDRKGGLTRLRPALYTVLVEPDEWRVTLTWCGFTRALRPYMFQELARMPFVAEW